MIHPVHYSLILNLVILAIAGFLAWTFANPLVFVCALLMIEHMVGMFNSGDKDSDRDGGGDGAQPMGFTASVG